MKSLDIGSFSESYNKANEEGRDVEILSPETSMPCGICVKISGPYSQRQEDAVRDLNDWTREHPYATADERRTAVIRRYARTVISWTWADGVTYHGNVPECTFENVVRVLTECRWISDQVVAEAGSSRGFIKD